jgi:hypothetical protein
LGRAPLGTVAFLYDFDRCIAGELFHAPEVAHNARAFAVDVLSAKPPF